MTRTLPITAKKAAEPVHIQLNLPDNALVVVNTTQGYLKGLTATTRVVSLDNRELFARTDSLDALANRATPLPVVPLDKLNARSPMVLVSPKLSDASGKLVSENFCWRGKEPASYRALNGLTPVRLDLKAEAVSAEDKEKSTCVTLRNSSQTPALNAKLTLVDGRGERILPAFYSDNYVSLLRARAR